MVRSITNGNNLINSSHWKQFLDSTATALQLNLIFTVPETGDSISVCSKCPICGTELLPLDYSNLNVHNGESITNGDTQISVFQLQQDYVTVARNFPCCDPKITMQFLDRVAIAKGLLDNFLAILIDRWNGEQMATELTALRQMNHIVLSMFRGENKALEHALDLVLSAFIILFDADGSWIQYSLDGNKHILKKGVCSISDDELKKDNDRCFTAEIESPVIKGQLGIISPEDKGRVTSFLSLMVQECLIVFEVDYLLKLMENRLTLVLGAVDDFIMLVDRHFSICYVNGAAEKFLGRTYSELMGLPLSKFPGPWNDCILGGTQTVKKGINDAVNSNLGEMNLDWSVYPLLDSSTIPGWLVIAEDRADFYRLQEIGFEAERMANTSTLLSVLSHEIRNPLATFRALLQLIKIKNKNASIDKHIELGISEVDRISQMLNDFMYMGKPLDVSRGPINLKTFLNNLMPLLNGNRINSPFEIKTDFQEVPLLFVDPQQLTQVILNLVRNAFDAVNQCGQVYISLHALNNEWVEITVRDTGPGISDEVKENLFRPFHTTKEGGTGLGLAISQMVIHNSGGKIVAKNHPSGGAVFSILLPVELKSLPLNKKTDVMIITDNDIVKLPIEQVLRADNINVVSMNNKNNAFFMLHRCLPSVIISEPLMMSLQDYENIHKKYPNVQLFLITEDEIFSGKEKLICMKKPVNYAKLVSLVKTALDQ
ncbi:MAG TPA: ATP-binding protein [Oscillospiraceae bacterium]|nr:ATP-binding protein [Oscillospiraceae bacterium]